MGKGGCQKSEKNVDVVYGWSLPALIGQKRDLNSLMRPKFYEGIFILGFYHVTLCLGLHVH